MSLTTTDMGTKELRASMMDILEAEAGRYGVVLTKPLPDRALSDAALVVAAPDARREPSFLVFVGTRIARPPPFDISRR